MRVCGRWFDAPLRDRIMGEIAAQPGLSRNALAAKVCGWTSWHNARGEPRLASARKALSELDRRGAIRRTYSRGGVPPDPWLTGP